ncbi:hypothetical protein C2W62_34895 [Candidatus Entotheonella serta]|nr:hypothetical protein C2W62_34895 [Candidatus Entotheonella serta]
MVPTNTGSTRGVERQVGLGHHRMLRRRGKRRYSANRFGPDDGLAQLRRPWGAGERAGCHRSNAKYGENKRKP